MQSLTLLLVSIVFSHGNRVQYHEGDLPSETNSSSFLNVAEGEVNEQLDQCNGWQQQLKALVQDVGVKCEYEGQKHMVRDKLKGSADDYPREGSKRECRNRCIINKNTCQAWTYHEWWIDWKLVLGGWRQRCILWSNEEAAKNGREPVSSWPNTNDNIYSGRCGPNTAEKRRWSQLVTNLVSKCGEQGMKIAWQYSMFAGQNLDEVSRPDIVTYPFSEYPIPSGLDSGNKFMKFWKYHLEFLNVWRKWGFNLHESSSNGSELWRSFRKGGGARNQRMELCQRGRIPDMTLAKEVSEKAYKQWVDKLGTMCSKVGSDDFSKR